MERYSFFDAVNSGSGYDRTYNAADIASYFSSFIGNGVYANPSNQLQVAPSKGLEIKVKTGKAWINGYFYELSEEDKTLTVERGETIYNRIDAVMLSLNLSKRLIELKVVKGKGSSSPVAPAPTRNESQYDLVLAEIHVASGATEIKQGMIYDYRPITGKCGFVSGVVEQIDTSGLFAQYDSKFNDWFEGIKGVLNGDVAGNLSNRLTALERRTTPVSKGGTGAITADAARKNLDVYSKAETDKVLLWSGTLSPNNQITLTHKGYTAFLIECDGVSEVIKAYLSPEGNQVNGTGGTSTNNPTDSTPEIHMSGARFEIAGKTMTTWVLKLLHANRITISVRSGIVENKRNMAIKKIWGVRA